MDEEALFLGPGRGIYSGRRGDERKQGRLTMRGEPALRLAFGFRLTSRAYRLVWPVRSSPASLDGEFM